MKMCEAMLMFILLLTGYLCNNMDVAANTTSSDQVTSSVSATSKATQIPELETPHESSDDLVEEQRPTPVMGTFPFPLLVAEIIISLVFLCILVIIGVWYVWKKAKGSSAETTSVPFDEPGVSLRKISTHKY